MLFESSLKEVASIERWASDRTAVEIIDALRVLGGSDFTLLLTTLPDPRFPNISTKLPHMPPASFQNTWNGSNGLELAKRTVSFCHVAGINYTRLTGKPFRDFSVLDFGCGYGRLMRAMYYYSKPDNVYGVDPWKKSLDACREYKLLGHISQSAYIPDDLGIEKLDFDFIYAHSVFTHLSKKATLACLGAIRKHIAEDGIVLITIRPEEYWYNNYPNVGGKQYEPGNQLHPYVALHREEGFSFLPHGNEKRGEATYGDTSLTLQWLTENADGWVIIGSDRLLSDPYQRYVFMAPS